MSDPVSEGLKRDAYIAGKESVRSIVQEFLVDLLGVFLPGVIFVAVAGACAYEAMNLISGVLRPGIALGRTAGEMTLYSDFVVGIVFFAVAYVTGHFFFRKPPAEPDLRSALRLSLKRYRAVKSELANEEPDRRASLANTRWRQWDNETPLPVKIPCCEQLHERLYAAYAGGLMSRSRASVRDCPKRIVAWMLSLFGGERPLPRQEGAAIEPDGSTCSLWPGGLHCHARICCHSCMAARSVEFPYNYLHEYLDDRMLKHLSQLVPWRGKKQKKEGVQEEELLGKARSKVFLNILKIRLESVLPRWCQVLTRNEAHVRLMSSSWFMARALFVCVCLLAICVCVSMLGIYALRSLYHGDALTLPAVIATLRPAVPFVAGSIWLLIGLCWSMCIIETFMLYQRIREVTQVLDVAYYAAVIHPELSVLAGLYQTEPCSVREAREANQRAAAKANSGAKNHKHESKAKKLDERSR